MKKPKTVTIKDPINGTPMRVRSVCRPKQSLLQGGVYSRHPVVLPESKAKLGSKHD